MSVTGLGIRLADILPAACAGRGVFGASSATSHLFKGDPKCLPSKNHQLSRLPAPM